MPRRSKIGVAGGESLVGPGRRTVGGLPFPGGPSRRPTPAGEEEETGETETVEKGSSSKRRRCSSGSGTHWSGCCSTPYTWSRGVDFGPHRRSCLPDPSPSPSPWPVTGRTSLRNHRFLWETTGTGKWGSGPRRGVWGHPEFTEKGEDEAGAGTTRFGSSSDPDPNTATPEVVALDLSLPDTSEPS